MQTEQAHRAKRRHQLSAPGWRELLQRIDSAELRLPEFCRHERVCKCSYYPCRSWLRANRHPSTAQALPCMALLRTKFR